LIGLLLAKLHYADLFSVASISCTYGVYTNMIDLSEKENVIRSYI